MYVETTMLDRTASLFAAAAAAGLVLIASSATAEARRKAPPKTEICNKTTSKQYVAVMNYAGRGMQSIRGWTYLAPGACRVYRDDRFHIRGKAKVTGLQTKHARTACIKISKVFRLLRQPGKVGDKAQCAADKGYLVRFLRPIPAGPGVSKTVVIGG